MKYLGIDYGTQKIGLAVSDASGTMAFPKTIIGSGISALRNILDLIASEEIEKIVVGNSMDLAGGRNQLMEDIDAFIEELEKLTGLPIVLQDERFTSSAVRAFDWTKPVATPRRTSVPRPALDDRAAAIMLQRYLDKQ